MRRLMRLPAVRLFRLGMASLYAALLVGLVIIVLAQPTASQAQAGSRSAAGAGPNQARGNLFSTHTPTPTATRTPTSTATPTPKPTTTSTPKPTATATATARPKATATPKPTATPSPSATPLPSATSSLADAAPPKPTPSVTATAHAGPGKGDVGGSGAGGGPVTAPPWVVEGLVILFLLLLGFSLVIFPLAVRSARSERRNQPIYKPAAHYSEDQQVSRITLIPPARQHPLSREQMLALRASQQQGDDIAQQSTASLPAMRLVNGVPFSPPGAGAAPQLTAPHRPGVDDGSGGAWQAGNSPPA